MRKTDIFLLNGLRAIAALPWLRGPASHIGALIHSEPTMGPSERFDGLLFEKSPSTIIEELECSGVSTGLRLDTRTLSKVLSACNEGTFVEDVTRNSVSFSEIGNRKTSNALRWIDPHKQSNFVSRIIHDDRIVEIARLYLGCDPILHSSQIWMLQPPASDRVDGHEYGWHYDIDDFRFLKLFIYLTNTQSTGGEHMLVRSSHRDRRRHRFTQRRIEDRKVRSLYLAEDILTMEGEAGMAFFEDTWLYHRATPPVSNRLMMQIEFCSTGVLKWLENRIYRH